MGLDCHLPGTGLTPRGGGRVSAMTVVTLTFLPSKLQISFQSLGSSHLFSPPPSLPGVPEGPGTR